MVRRETFASLDRLAGSCAVVVPGKDARTRIGRTKFLIKCDLKAVVYLVESAINDIFQRQEGIEQDPARRMCD